MWTCIVDEPKHFLQVEVENRASGVIKLELAGDGPCLGSGHRLVVGCDADRGRDAEIERKALHWLLFLVPVVISLTTPPGQDLGASVISCGPRL